MSDLLRYRQIHLDFHTSEQLTNIGGEFDVLEDVLPLYDVAVSLRPPGAVAGVRCAPQGETLPYTEEDGRLSFTAPRVEGHQMVEIGLA